MDNWNKIFKPIVVLACICIVVTTALALTNEATAPIIAQLAEEAAQAARAELMPGADFEAVSCDSPNVTDVYKATDDSGYIITANSKGYGGTMVIMVAFSSDGNISKIKVQSHAETVGIGDKVEAESFWGQYGGKPSSELALGTDIDKVTGATISSRGVNNAVNAAIVAYNAVS